MPQFPSSCAQYTNQANTSATQQSLYTDGLLAQLSTANNVTIPGLQAELSRMHSECDGLAKELADAKAKLVAKQADFDEETRKHAETERMRAHWHEQCRDWAMIPRR